MSRPRLAAAAALLAACAAALPAVRAQITPTAPVKNFHLPMFAADGTRLWELRGEEALAVEARRVDVTRMTLRLFGADAGVLVTAPQATVLIPERQAHGRDAVTVRAPAYAVTGRDWTFDGLERRVVIRQQARTVFFEELNSILR